MPGERSKNALKRLHRSGMVGLAVGLGLASAPASAAPAIQWEVVNRFPFFPNDEVFRQLLGIYQALPANERHDQPVMALERAMEQQADARTLPAIFGANRDELRRSGWTSVLFGKTCFDEAGRSHANCRLSNREDFLKQETTAIKVTLSEAPANQSCTWLVDNAAQTPQPCGSSLTLAKVDLRKPFSLAVKIDDSVIAQADSQAIQPLLIVGMGDSFAAGEGNPDHPVAFLSDGSSDYQQSSPFQTSGWPRTYRAFPLTTGTVVDPNRGSLGVKAGWLSEQCHRSLYSHQLRAALQIALEQPHVSVTYIGYACSGAEVYEGLLGRWTGKDDAARGLDSAPQIVRALRDLCDDATAYPPDNGPSAVDTKPPPPIKPCVRMRHPIDALLLSIGGNDIGFSSVIANEAVNSGKHAWLPFLSQTRYKLWRALVKPIPFATAQQREKVLRGRLGALSRSLVATMQLQPDKVIQTGYPQLLKTSQGACPKGNAGMDVHAIFGIRSTTGSNSLPFLVGLNKALTRDSPFKPVVDDFADSFSGHSLCDGGTEKGADAADGMVFPTYDFDRMIWKPLNPARWQPYLPRMRWFVTPNDAFLAGHYMRTASGGGGDPNPQGVVQPLLAATVSGAFHPNALGQAAIGDSVVRQLRVRLNLQQPEAAPAPDAPH